MIGTLRKNSKHIPKSILQPNLKQTKGDVVAKEKDGIVVGCWKNKREVRFLFTKHTAIIQETGKKMGTGDPIKKPDVILEYNKCKQGVDVSDQMSSYFCPVRKSLFWYNKVAFELLLGTAVVNAFQIYNKLSNKKKHIGEFREDLIMRLLDLEQQPPRAIATPVH